MEPSIFIRAQRGFFDPFLWYSIIITKHKVIVRRKYKHIYWPVSWKWNYQPSNSSLPLIRSIWKRRRFFHRPDPQNIRASCREHQSPVQYVTWLSLQMPVHAHAVIHFALIVINDGREKRTTGYWLAPYVVHLCKERDPSHNLLPLMYSIIKSLVANMQTVMMDTSHQGTFIPNLNTNPRLPLLIVIIDEDTLQPEIQCVAGFTD